MLRCLLTWPLIRDARRWSEKGAMWSLRGSASRLSQDAAGLRKWLCGGCAEIGRATGLREFLPDTRNDATRELAEEHLGSWCSWAARCRLERFEKLARAVREHAGTAFSTATKTGPPVRPSSHCSQSYDSPARGSVASATATTSGPSSLPDPITSRL